MLSRGGGGSVVHPYPVADLEGGELEQGVSQDRVSPLKSDDGEGVLTVHARFRGRVAGGQLVAAQSLVVDAIEALKHGEQ